MPRAKGRTYLNLMTVFYYCNMYFLYDILNPLVNIDIEMMFFFCQK